MWKISIVFASPIPWVTIFIACADSVLRIVAGRHDDWQTRSDSVSTRNKTLIGLLLWLSAAILWQLLAINFTGFRSWFCDNWWQIVKDTAGDDRKSFTWIILSSLVTNLSSRLLKNKVKLMDYSGENSRIVASPRLKNETIDHRQILKTLSTNCMVFKKNN
jgi:hypothetical protein